MDKFLKIQNFQICKSAFTNWMDTKYGFNLNANDMENTSSEMLFEIMRAVKDEFIDVGDVSIKELNDVSLNRLTDVFVDTYKLSKMENATKTGSNHSQLERDSNVFGSRALTSTLLLPENTTNKDFEDVGKQFDMAMSNRNLDMTNSQPPAAPDFQQLKDEPVSDDMFEKLLNNRRDLESNLELKMPLVPDDPKAFFTSLQQPIATVAAAPDNTPFEFTSNNVGIVEYSKTPTHSTALVIDQPTQRTIMLKYITINGFDRDWLNASQKKRFSYRIDFTKLTSNYRNISSIKFSKLIIPNEVLENRSITNAPKFVHHHDHKLAYPYLLLQVDEIGDLCDGLSQQVQKSFAQFIYDKSYKCPNGRGYVIMVPAQDETKVFYPQNMASLQRLTFSILKPNGTLFNNSQDDYSVIKVEYELYNTLYIKIVTDKYFDKNEFFIGDSIMIDGYSMYRPPTAPPCTSSMDYAAMAQFVNRVEGHEIVQLGEANENGFYRSLYVLGPCRLDQTIGKLVVQKELVDALKEYNQVSTPHVSGSIINTSLQSVISMTIGTDVADRGILMTRPI